MMILMCSFFILIIMVFNFMKNKILIIMTMEIIMLIILFSFIFNSSNFNMMVYSMMVLSIFMVLDSVLGISTLIHTVRNSTSSMVKVKMI